MHAVVAPRALLLLALALLPACRGCKKGASSAAPAGEPARPPTSENDEAEEEDELEEQEQRSRERDEYWRVGFRIVGQGTLRSFIDAFDCTSDGARQSGECGPKLVRFKELRPATVKALPAPGWRFDHWESLIRAPDGATAPRSGPMPDGILYLNGFGPTDTGASETVTAVFVAVAEAGADAAPDRRGR